MTEVNELAKALPLPSAVQVAMLEIEANAQLRHAAFLANGNDDGSIADRYRLMMAAVGVYL